MPIRLTQTPTRASGCLWEIRGTWPTNETGQTLYDRHGYPSKERSGISESLPEFQRLFPDDAACAGYLERARWADGFVCPYCGVVAEPFRITTRPGILECRTCRRQTGLLVGTVMERSHTPLNIWFWAAYLVMSHTPGISAVQFQRQLGLSRYETAFGILHKLRAGMVRPDQDRIGGKARRACRGR